MFKMLKWVYELGYDKGYEDGYKRAKAEQHEFEVWEKVKKEMEQENE